MTRKYTGWYATISIFLVLIIPSFVSSHQSAADSSTGVIIPLFSYPTNPAWNAVYQAKIDHPSVPIISTINPNSGSGTSKDANFVIGIQKLHSAGVIVLGYVPTNYATVSISSAETMIDNYKNWYSVDGIMFDEMTNDAGNETYYSTLSKYAKVNDGMSITVANPGGDVAPSYIGTVDNLTTYESQGLPTIPQLVSWHTGYPKSNFSMVAFAVNSLNSTFVSSASNYVGYMYITDDGLPNPYDTVPSYLATLVTYLDTGSSPIGTIVMSDTTASFASLISSPRQFIGELASPTSVLVGKQIDSITLKLQKVGAPTGTSQVGIFDINRNVVKSFGTIDVSTISTTATDYEFKLLSTDPLYTIKSGDRIGFKYTGGSATTGVNVTPDRDAANPFDGANSYRVRYEAAWVDANTEDMYMILKQTHGTSSSLPGISINDVSLAEGNTGTKNFIFTVTRSGNTIGTSSVNYATSDGTAPLSNSDYVSKSGSLVFTPGQTTKTVSVLVNGNQIVEPTETFNVNLSSCTGCSITDNQGVGTILNDDSSTSLPITVMSDTTASFASLISAPRQFIGEFASPTSTLVGKQIDSITLQLQKVGAPTGTAQVGIFDINRNVVKQFGTITVSTISTTATDYEFKLLSTDPLYTIKSGDRIGFKYTGGSATVGVNVTPDRDAADPFDGANSYRVRYEAAWVDANTEDTYMILKQTR